MQKQPIFLLLNGKLSVHASDSPLSQELLGRGVKSSVTRQWNEKLPNFSQYCPKRKQFIFTRNSYHLKLSKHLPEYLGYFCKKNCYQEV